MNNCLMSYYIVNNDVISTCDFIPKNIFEGKIFYEVIRVINAKPLFLSDHITRFFSSISLSGSNILLSSKDIAFKIKSLIEYNNLIDGNIRFQINISKKETFTAWISPFSYPDKSLYETGISLNTINIQRINPNQKQNNNSYKETVNTFITNSNCYEALLVNDDNTITEGSKSNIFFVNDNCIFTPPSKSVLPGITRQKVIEICKNNALTVYEEEIKKSDIKNFDAAFITGTSPKVLPAYKIDDIALNPSNKTILLISSNYNNSIQTNIDTFNWSNYI